MTLEPGKCYRQTSPRSVLSSTSFESLSIIPDDLAPTTLACPNPSPNGHCCRNTIIQSVKDGRYCHSKLRRQRSAPQPEKHKQVQRLSKQRQRLGSTECVANTDDRSKSISSVSRSVRCKACTVTLKEDIKPMKCAVNHIFSKCVSEKNCVVQNKCHTAGSVSDCCGIQHSYQQTAMVDLVKPDSLKFLHKPLSNFSHSRLVKNTSATVTIGYIDAVTTHLASPCSSVDASRNSCKPKFTSASVDCLNSDRKSENKYLLKDVCSSIEFMPTRCHKDFGKLNSAAHYDCNQNLLKKRKSLATDDRPSLINPRMLFLSKHEHFYGLEKSLQATQPMARLNIKMDPDEVIQYRFLILFVTKLF